MKNFEGLIKEKFPEMLKELSYNEIQRQEKLFELSNNEGRFVGELGEMISVSINKY